MTLSKKFIQFKYLLEEYIIKENNIERFSSILDENFKSNIENYNYNIDKLFGKYKNKNLYLVSAGPSLDKNIHELKKVRDTDIVFSVGRAVRPLLKANIRPDYIIITDPSERLYDMQLKGLDIDVPIIVLSTCDKNVMLNYKGIKYIALQNGYSPAEEYAENKGNLLVETGGSVATTALDVAIRMGFSRIVFVGQDLAFTDNKTHSKDTFSQSIKNDDNLREIQDINDSTIKTFKNLYIYLRWIQKRIKEENYVEFIDSTEGGAKIMGTKIMKLSDTFVD